MTSPTIPMKVVVLGQDVTLASKFMYMAFTFSVVHGRMIRKVFTCIFVSKSC